MSKKLDNLTKGLLLETPTAFACLFAGTALYMSELDPIVRSLLENKKSQLRHWAKMYSLGKVTMPIAVALGSGAAVGAYLNTKETVWLWGAATFFSIIPFTFIFLMPTNRYLEGVLQATAEAEVAESDKERVTK
jgi:Domain of unknown function (DUF1772)